MIKIKKVILKNNYKHVYDYWLAIYLDELWITNEKYIPLMNYLLI